MTVQNHSAREARVSVTAPQAAARSSLAGEDVQFVTDVDKVAFVRILAPLYPKLVTDPRHRALVDQIRASE